jgi:hypothetical protein
VTAAWNDDVRLPAQQMLAADYTDDQPEAVNYTYPTGEAPRAVEDSPS